MGDLLIMAPNNENRPTKASVGATTPRTSLEKQALYDNSPPRTPPSQTSRIGKSKGGVRAPRTRPSLRNAFDDNDDHRHHHARDAASNVHNRKRSNSHDLSWSPRNTRDSVVDNMLLSLDQWPNDVAAASPGATVAKVLPLILRVIHTRPRLCNTILRRLAGLAGIHIHPLCLWNTTRLDPVIRVNIAAQAAATFNLLWVG